MKKAISFLLLLNCVLNAIPAKADSWMRSNYNYTINYWHEAFSPIPQRRTIGTSRFSDSALPVVPSDVYIFGSSGAFDYGVTNNFDVGACIERELHDNQWLAGGCKDILYLLHTDAAGNIDKVSHFGGAVMSNAQHANTTYQIKGGFDLNTAGGVLFNGLTLAAPTLANLNVDIPTWISKIGNAVTFDFSGGYRPVHDSTVKGNLTYGIMAMVNVPIATSFEWIISGFQ